MTRRTGTVKWFNDAKGFGFITAENVDYFVHRNAIAINGEGSQTLTEGDRVEFNVMQKLKGPSAENVVKL